MSGKEIHVHTASPSRDSLQAGLVAGVRWLYGTVQPPAALVERRGARLTVDDRVLRFIPIGASGTPLIVVDLRSIRWGLVEASPRLNALGPDELPALVTGLEGLGVPSAAVSYHRLTGTVALEIAAHPSLVAAVHRFDQGCPYHHSQVCEAPLRDGGQACPWHRDGHRAAIWPHLGDDEPAPSTTQISDTTVVFGSPGSVRRSCNMS